MIREQVRRQELEKPIFTGQGERQGKLANQSRLRHPILRLQQTIGNRAVGQMLQATLTINEAGDEYEREADQVAEQVMQISQPPTPIQRECACGQHTAGGECDECRKKRLSLQRQTSEFSRTPEVSTEVPPIVQEVLRSPGQPLDAATRAFMESSFGYDFSRVRVHTDARAVESARAVNALAYTVGRDVVFGAGECWPHTRAGKRLLAHELTHTVQQGGVESAATAAAGVIQRKPVKPPYRAEIVAPTDAAGRHQVIQTCQDVNARGCRTNVLLPGMEVTITDEFVGGGWLFAQQLPEQAVAALHGQKWIYVPAKFIRRIPSGRTPTPRPEAVFRAAGAARVQQLNDAIYGADRTKAIDLLNEGGLDDALQLLHRAQAEAVAKGQISPAAYLADDFPLTTSRGAELRVALVARSVKLAAGDWSGSAEDAYDELMTAARRLGGLSPGTVAVYLDRHGVESIKSVVEQRRTEQARGFAEQYERIRAAERDPLEVFKQALQQRTLRRLDENEAAVRKERDALASGASADAAWKRLETVVVPQAIYYAQLGTLEEKLTSLVQHTAKAVAYAKAGKDNMAAIEYSEERGTPPAGAWWRPHRIPFGGGGADYPPPIAEIEEELKEDEQQLASVSRERAGLQQRLPLVKALRPALLKKLEKGPASRDRAAVSKFRSSTFLDLQKQVFEVALSAIKMLREDVEAGRARLYSYQPLIEEVKAELMLGSDQEMQIDRWIKDLKGRDEVIRVVTTALSIAVLPFVLLPGGALVAAVLGTISAVHGAEVAGEKYTAAKAGMAGQEITAESLEATRSEANWALLDLVLSGLDLGAAVRAVVRTKAAVKGAAAAEDAATRAQRAAREQRGARALLSHGRVPGLPGCRAGSVNCPIEYMREALPNLFRRRETAEFAEYIHPAAYEIDLKIGQSLRKEMTIKTGDSMYRQYLHEVKETEWSEPFKKAVYDARQPGIDHRIITVEGQPRIWPLDALEKPWVVHHDPPLYWTSKSEGAHLWHPMPLSIHYEAHAWWNELDRLIRKRVRLAGYDLSDDFDIREVFEELVPPSSRQ